MYIDYQGTAVDTQANLIDTMTTAHINLPRAVNEALQPVALGEADQREHQHHQRAEQRTPEDEPASRQPVVGQVRAHPGLGAEEVAAHEGEWLDDLAPRLRGESVSIESV